MDLLNRPKMPWENGAQPLNFGMPLGVAPGTSASAFRPQTPFGASPFAQTSLLSTLANRLGYGGLQNVLGAYQNAPSMGGPAGALHADVPNAAPQPDAQGGAGGWFTQHRGMLGDAGKLALGAFSAFDAYQSHKAERDEVKRAREERERQRRDQEAAASAVAPGYAELLKALQARMGYGG